MDEYYPNVKIFKKANEAMFLWKYLRQFMTVNGHLLDDLYSVNTVDRYIDIHLNTMDKHHVSIIEFIPTQLSERQLYIRYNFAWVIYQTPEHIVLKLRTYLHTHSKVFRCLKKIYKENCLKEIRRPTNPSIDKLISQPIKLPNLFVEYYACS